MHPAVAQFARRHRLTLIVLAILTIYGCEAHARRRIMATPATLGDQGAYLAYARLMHESGYAFVGDRNRMPIFPFLLSLLYRPGEPEEEFLRRAQAFNVNLSIVLLLALFFIFRKFFRPSSAVALMAATAFGVFMYRVPNAQVEVLFYTVSFCAFVLFWRMLVAPGWWLAILCGITMGLAHLTKASLLPALGVWVAVFAVQSFWPNPVRTAVKSGSLWRRLGLLCVVVAAFLTVVFPYIRNSKRIYGQYFYNVNSAFVMWCDSSDEGHKFLEEWGLQGKWRALPPEQLPSAGKYWREHSIGQIAYRIGHGLRDLATQNAMAIGYYKFVVALALAAAILCARHRRRARHILAEHPFAALFCVSFVALYLILFGWYDMIVNDTRFVLLIFLPFLFAASIFVLALARDRVVTIAGRRLAFPEFFAGLLLALTMIDVLYNGARALI
jgi:hypothetical protein